MARRFSQVLFYFFSDMKDYYKKNNLWSFLLVPFSNSLNMKKDRVLITVRLVKASNSDRLVHRDKIEFHLQ